MKPETVKTVGYLISTASVLLLGIAAWPGAAEAHLLPVLILGMATSIVGMGCRWLSYEMEHHRQVKRPSDLQRAARPTTSWEAAPGNQ